MTQMEPADPKFAQNDWATDPNNPEFIWKQMMAQLDTLNEVVVEAFDSRDAQIADLTRQLDEMAREKELYLKVTDDAIERGAVAIALHYGNGFDSMARACLLAARPPQKPGV